MYNPLPFYRGEDKEQFPCGDPPENATFGDFVVHLAKLFKSGKAPLPPGNFGDIEIKVGFDDLAAVIMDAVHGNAAVFTNMSRVRAQSSAQLPSWRRSSFLRDIADKLDRADGRAL
jgi:hypothetical protein